MNAYSTIRASGFSPGGLQPFDMGKGLPPSAGDAGIRLQRRTRLMVGLVAALVIGMFGLSAMLEVGGAVIGKGELAAASHVKTIVHPSGGVLQALYVHEGDRVRSGQVLMRFDTGVAEVGAMQARASVDELLARRARLEAERDGSSVLHFPPELIQSKNPATQALLARERRQFELKAHERAGSLALLRERVHQYREQIGSYDAQIGAGRRQSALIEPELAGVRDLYDRKLVTVAHKNQLERTAVELAGSRAALEANVAQTRASIAEVGEQMLNVDQTARADAATELAQVLGQLNDQLVRRVTATDTLDRSTIRAPQAGVIDKLAYSTIGSAVPAGQPILQIVPDRDHMIVEGRIAPADIDQISIGQGARVNFVTLNRQTTPEVHGTVRFVSAEPVEDSRTGQSYYRVRVDLDASSLARAVKVRLLTGTPVELFVETGSRSILSYIFKPLRDQLSHAMREE